MSVDDQNTLFFLGLVGVIALTIIICQIQKRRK